MTLGLLSDTTRAYYNMSDLRIAHAHGPLVRLEHARDWPIATIDKAVAACVAMMSFFDDTTLKTSIC